MSTEPPTESMRELDTVPDNVIPEPPLTPKTDPDTGASVVTNLLGDFLKKQEKRDAEFRETVVEALKEAMLDRSELQELRGRVDSLEKLVRKHLPIDQ